MSPERTTLAARATATLLLPCALAACGVFKNNEGAQALINQRVVGMPVGDFFTQFGFWKTRDEQLDGSTRYVWISAAGTITNPVYYGLDDRLCTLQIIAAKSGRIASANVLHDNVGRTSTSRCSEMFRAG